MTRQPVQRPAPRRRPGLERLRRRVLQPFFTRLGYDLLPATPEWEHRPLSKREVERLLDGCAAQLRVDFAAAGIEPQEDLGRIAYDFWSLIRACPVRQRHGGNGFNGALQVYAAVRSLRPALIVESGVFRGLTTWLMRQAAPGAAIYCFDPVLDNLHYRDADARYFTHDWSLFDMSVLDVRDSLAFFDDHISQGQRILEASDRGFTRLLFDDNAAAQRIHSHGGPAFPTLDMILDDRAQGEAVRWVRNFREFTYTPDPAFVADVRSRIAGAHDFDDGHRITGYSPARISYVRLHPR